MLEKETHLRHVDNGKSIRGLFKFGWIFTVIKVDSDSTLQTSLFDVFYCEWVLFFWWCQCINFASKRMHSLSYEFDGLGKDCWLHTYLNGKTSPSTAKFKKSVSGFHTPHKEHGGFLVVELLPDLQVSVPPRDPPPRRLLLRSAERMSTSSPNQWANNLLQILIISNIQEREETHTISKGTNVDTSLQELFTPRKRKHYCC